MLTKRELKELASLQIKDALFVSLYLNVDPKQNPKGDWQRHFKNMVRETLAKLKANERGIIQGDLEKIEAYINDRPTDLKCGLAIVSSVKEKVWAVFNSAVPFSNELVVHKDPYIKPMRGVLNLYKRYLIVIADNERVRLLISGMGEIAEVKVIEKPALEFDPDRDGGFGDAAEKRMQASRDKARRLLFKEAGIEIDKIRHTEEIRRVLLAGTDANRAKFRESLSDGLKPSIVGEFVVNHLASAPDVLQRSGPVVQEYEKILEKKATEELFTRAGSAESAVLGLSDVLTALQQGNVHKLYTLTAVKSQGMKCTLCGALTPMRDNPCPYCGGDLLHVPYMIDMAIQKAVELGAHIGVLEHSPELHKAGGIGAVLRY